MLLAAGLAAGLQVTALAIALFGPSPMVVALFAAILATSFFITGVSQVAIAITGRAPPQRDCALRATTRQLPLIAARALDRPRDGRVRR